MLLECAPTTEALVWSNVNEMYAQICLEISRHKTEHNLINSPICDVYIYNIYIYIYIYMI